MFTILLYVSFAFVVSQIKEYKQKVGCLKKSHQTEKQSQEQVLEEARKNASDDANQLKVSSSYVCRNIFIK